MQEDQALVRPGKGPLDGFRVIEMAGLGPGPFCAMLLADMGAEVIRIQSKGKPQGLLLNTPFDVLARGRRSLAIDLKMPGAKDVMLDLIGQADALIEGFRPGVMERLGLGPEVCLARNPRLVYGRMTGWGQSGPLAQSAGHDINYLALTGVLTPSAPAAFHRCRSTSSPTWAVGAFCWPSASSVHCSKPEVPARGRLWTLR